MYLFIFVCELKKKNLLAKSAFILWETVILWLLFIIILAITPVFNVILLFFRNQSNMLICCLIVLWKPWYIFSGFFDE